MSETRETEVNAEDSADIVQPGQNSRALTVISKIISTVGHPLIVPLLAVTLLLFGNTFLSIIPFGIKRFILLTVLMCTMIIPAFAIVLLYRLKVISAISLDNRKDRTIPLLIVIISYILCSVFLTDHIIMQLINRIIYGVILAISLCFIITFFWKISMHMIGAGGLVGVFFSVNFMNYGYMPWTLMFTILLAGLVGSARLYLGKHTIWQVFAGFMVGFLSVIIMLRF